MDLQKIQEMKRVFGQKRGWDKFNPSQIFTHLIEELGEISRYISVEEGYKAVGLGHKEPNMVELSREFAQAFNLFVQLANHFSIDLESAVLDELDIMATRFPEEEWRKYMESR